jgi:ribonuclease P protein component
MSELQSKMPELPPRAPHDANANVARTFPKSVRLRKSKEFEAVYGVRQSAGDSTLVVHGRFNGLSHARLGLTVSRRVGNAVVRNRWKRALREAFRQVRHRLPALDVVVAPRPGVRPNTSDLMKSLPSLIGRVEKRLRTGVAPYPPRKKPAQQKAKALKKPNSPESSP